MKGQRIAIYGLGRSGLAIARAALSLGAVPTVYDKARPDQMIKQDVLTDVRSLGIEMHLGWEGRFDPASVDMLVTNPGVDMRSTVLQQAVTDGIEVVSEVEFAYRVLEARQDPNAAMPQRPNARIPIVAITGTNGKSTTTVMTYLALQECGIDAVLCGNIFGTGFPEIPLTEAALNAKPNQVLVAEISSFQLEWVSHFSPAVAGITNIAPDHLDRYDSFGQYSATKFRIFAGQDDGDYAVIEGGTAFQAVSDSGFQPEIQDQDGPGTHRLEGDATVVGRHPRLSALPRLLTFGPDGEHAQVRGTEIEIFDKVIETHEMQVVGAHNYSNAAMAGLMAFATLAWLAKEDRLPAFSSSRLMAMARIVDAKADGPLGRRHQTTDRSPQATVPDCIVTALKAFKGIEHRMEFVGEKNGVKIINNSMCTNPEAVVASAKAIDATQHLLIGGKDKDLPFKPVKDLLSQSLHKAYLYGEAKDSLNNQLGGGFSTYNSLQDAFRAATEKARPGEVIMLAPGCASTDQFNDFRDRGNVFKKIAKEWLES